MKEATTYRSHPMLQSDHRSLSAMSANVKAQLSLPRLRTGAIARMKDANLGPASSQVAMLAAYPPANR